VRVPWVAGAAALLLVFPVGCADATRPAEEGLGRDRFIATYVDLRVAALRNGGILDPRTRETVLAEHGVTAEELLAFARTWGGDPRTMQEVWADVEERLDSIRVLGDRGG
jgi:hypothetical protein